MRKEELLTSFQALLSLSLCWARTEHHLRETRTTTQRPLPHVRTSEPHRGSMTPAPSLQWEGICPISQSLEREKAPHP